MHEGSAVPIIQGVDIRPLIEEECEKFLIETLAESVVQGVLSEGVDIVHVGAICQESASSMLVFFGESNVEWGHAQKVGSVRVSSTLKQGGVGRLIACGKGQGEGCHSRGEDSVDIGAILDQLLNEKGVGAPHAGIGEEGGETATRGAIKIARRPIAAERTKQVDDGERICVARAMPQRNPAIAILDMGIGSGIEEHFYLGDCTIGSGEMQGGAAIFICQIGIGSGGEEIRENVRGIRTVDRQTEWGIAAKIGNVHISSGGDEASERFSCMECGCVPESCSPFAVLTLRVCSTSQEFLHSCIKIDGCSDH